MGAPVSLSLAAEPASVSQARAFLSRALAPALFDGCRDDAVLALSELVTNAIVHGDGGVEVRVTPGAASVRLEVDDRSADEPALVAPSTSAVGGRGLQIVAQLATAWGSQARPGGGKTVWCELAV